MNPILVDVLPNDTESEVVEELIPEELFATASVIYSAARTRGYNSRLTLKQSDH